MNDADISLYVMGRLWLLCSMRGIDEFEFKHRAEELLFFYSQMQKKHTAPAVPNETAL